MWACRETFVAIIVTNLPIVHPLLRQLAKFVGLEALSGKSKSQSQSYPLQSTEGTEQRKNKSRSKHVHPLSIPNDTAWASDEHILPADGGEKSTSNNSGSGGIVVAQEVSVSSEVAEGTGSSLKSGRLRGDDWGLKNTTCVGGNVPSDGM